MSWEQRREYLVVVLLACGGEMALRLLPLRRTVRLFRFDLDSSRRAVAPPIEVLPAWAIQRIRVVRVVMRRWPVDGVCLRDALVTGHRLRALRPRLKLGVARSGTGDLQAHAWLEIDGRSLDPSYLEYAELPLP